MKEYGISNIRDLWDEITNEKDNNWVPLRMDRRLLDLVRDELNKLELNA